MVEKYITPYEQVGEETLSMLVDAFYKRVGNHPELSPIFPDDLTDTARKQKQFLTQYLGGPPLYTTEHGHPMLRARHLPHKITPNRAKAWIACMNEAMDEIGLDGPVRDEFFSRLVLTSHHMTNSEDELKGEEN
jgi:hemoglobin